MMADPVFANKLASVVVVLESMGVHRSNKEKFTVILDRGVRGAYERALKDIGADGGVFDLDRFYFDNVPESVRSHEVGTLDTDVLAAIASGGYEEDETVDWMRLLQEVEIKHPGIVSLTASCLAQDDAIAEKRNAHATQVRMRYGVGPMHKPKRKLY